MKATCILPSLCTTLHDVRPFGVLSSPGPRDYAHSCVLLIISVAYQWTFSVLPPMFWAGFLWLTAPDIRSVQRGALGSIQLYFLFLPLCMCCCSEHSGFLSSLTCLDPFWDNQRDIRIKSCLSSEAWLLKSPSHLLIISSWPWWKY